MYYTECPDSWKVLRISVDEVVLWKILCSWNGGYLGSDSWKISSQIEKIERHDDCYLTHNNSGSVYKLYKSCQRMSTLMEAQLYYYRKLLLDNNAKVKLEIDDGWLQNF